MSTISAGTTSTTTLVHSGDTTGSLVFKTNDTGSGGTTAVTIDTSQNVGIGNAIPSSFYSEAKNLVIGTGTGGQGLSVYSGSASQGRIMFANGTSGSQAYNGFVQYDHSSNSLQFGTNGGNERMRIDSSGNVGIGTSSPATELQLYKNKSGDTTKLNITNPNDTGGVLIQMNAQTTSPYQGVFGVANAGGYMQIGMVSSHPIQFITNSTERMRIDSSGNLLVGQTSQTGSEKIGVTQSGATSATAYFYATAGNYSNAVITSRCARGSATTEYNFLECSQVSTLQLVIRANGNVVNTNNSYGSISDIKLKENITDATPKLADLMQVKVRNYNLKTEPDHKQLGVIAQELEQVFPSMIEEAPDRDEEGNDLGTTTKSVKYSVFIPMLIKSIQEQQALITAQAETINALTARVVALESK